VSTTKIDYIRVGSGPVQVLALHASGTGAGSLVRLAKALGDEVSVLIPNLHGYGDSVAINASASNPLAQHFEVASAALDLFEGQPVHIFGHSMGAFVALMLASQGANNIVSMSLAEPVCFGLLHPEEDADVIEADRHSVSGLLAGNADGVATFIEYWNGTPWSVMPSAVKHGLTAMRNQISREALCISADRTPISDYNDINCPVQIMVGARTNPVAKRVCERFAEQRPAWPQVAIEKAGHMLPIEQPEAVAACVKATFALA